jgi:hypothetical protein
MTSIIEQVDGYQIYGHRHGLTIFEQDFPEAAYELTRILNSFYIPKHLIVVGGGGLSGITQILKKALEDAGWDKRVIHEEYIIDGQSQTSDSHEIDHFKRYEDNQPGIGLEIEWNNKDPFYDRDLENFRKYHALSLISLGIIITRGESLQRELYNVFEQHFIANPNAIEEQIPRYQGLSAKVLKNPDNRTTIVAKHCYSSKYGTATTHWDKLIQKINRKVGDPCPLVLIGIGAERLV